MTFSFEFLCGFHRRCLSTFSIPRKAKKWPKTQNKGGGLLPAQNVQLPWPPKCIGDPSRGTLAGTAGLFNNKPDLA